ncbi:cryptochrome/photolyase family protein [Methylobacterium terrae]|uniref:Cryptochrome/photolyase family protein n=1 Tax=Methylobacterium terrae TaxID=2202827 RepID=A0A2U8WL18_9HYPH|nr:cryptochrome/photolyase family protein [Methylobacterium terrae]AWN46944.1 cryptochrome/photolyase family protein [Methylobacterium terrae]
MGILRFVLGDQLHPRLASLTDLDPAADTVLMVEVAEEATYVRHHKQKLVLVFSAMRHFAADLRARGVAVDYVALEDPGNTGSFTTELERAVARRRPGRIVVTEAGEWRVEAMMRDWEQRFGIPVEIRDDTRFLCPRPVFARWAEGREALRMETFYRAMRRRTGFLMEGREPVGGRWNFDHDNRRRLPAGHAVPDRLRFPPDAVTQGVMDLVARRFPDHFGDLDAFAWPVSRADALAALSHFLDACLPEFGDYQDAMRAGTPFLYHGLIAPALNLGLLDAEEVCRAAEDRWREGSAPLNAVEGFIRQILGWREYVRGLYWARMPDYSETNALDATRPLPWFYWSGETRMACLAECVRDTKTYAHAHHIQRLMVLGNFALIAGLAPAEVEEWFLVVYADAYEWVELPNVHGMALWADGGLLGSKPYAASGAYIDRMSDYCGTCAYDVRKKAGPKACPFNYLYWNFLIANEDRLAGNPRMAMPYRTLARMSAARRDEIAADAARFLDALSASDPSGSEGHPGGERAVDARTPDLFLVDPAG